MVVAQCIIISCHTKVKNMDEKFLIKAIVFNTCWVLWIALSVFFGYLIAVRYFADNILIFIPFSLIFMAAGGIAAFFAYRILFKKTGKESVGQNAEYDSKANNKENSDT